MTFTSMKTFLCAGVATIPLLMACPAWAQMRSFDIPQEAANKAIPEFARQAGIQIIAPGDQLQNVETRAVKGNLDVHAALRQLLEGTSAVIASDDGQTIVLKVTSKNALAAPVDEAAQSGTLVETVVVTGSHIRGGDPISPLVTITDTDLGAQGYTRLDQALQQLPQNLNDAMPSANGTFGVGNKANYNSNYASSVDLFGLGAGTTLTLLNGQRLAPNNSGSRVDISGIPVSAIKKVEILEDGASAVYGADAIGGVVNIITKTDYDGIETGFRLTGLSDGKDPDVGASVLAGTGWGSGNVLVSADYEKDNTLLASSRSFTSSLPAPAYLIPSAENVRLYAAVRQELMDKLTFSAEALVSYRQYYSAVNNLLYGYGITSTQGGDRQQSGAAELQYELSPTWNLSLQAQYSRDSNHLFGAYEGLDYSYSDSERDVAAGFQAGADGVLFSLPGGDMAVAMGYQYRGDAYRTLSTNYHRYVNSAYGELSIPLVGAANAIPGIQQLMISISGRYDSYSDFGVTANPKIGVKWMPTDNLSLHGTFATSFKAPDLANLYTRRDIYIYPSYFTDPSSPTGTSKGIVLTGGNPDLKAQTSRSFNVGADYKPDLLPGLDVNISYFNFDFSNRIDRVDFDGFFQNAITAAAQIGRYAILNPTADQVAATLASGPPITDISGGYVPSDIKVILDDRYNNMGSTFIDGLNSHLAYDLGTEAGKFKFALDSVWFFHSDNQFTPTSPQFSVLNTLGQNLRFRAKLSAGWELKTLSAHARLNYQNSYANTVSPGCTGGAGCPISSWTTVDIGAAYTSADTQDGLLGGLRFNVDVTNLFNADPPYTVTNGFLPITYDPVNANPLGRYVSLTVTKAW